MFTYKPHERIHFKELELMVIQEWSKRGYVNTSRESPLAEDQIRLGNMVMELILVAENMGLDLTDCLNIAYKARIAKSEATST